ncbi:unnamed protein product [Orchesella dallaii]|uniref:Gustatory receptor n=1 Tax=Orchesella dallaii TaxID=48710 RepID=A0ABP1QID3_9HEXA
MALRSLNRCLHRQTHNTDNDLEIQSHANGRRNKNDNRGTTESIIAAIESLTIVGDYASCPSVTSRRSNLLEIFLSFYYYIGVSPFRVDGSRNVRSNWINKVNVLAISVCALTGIISLISTVGGLIILDANRNWSIMEILYHHEDKFFLGLKMFYNDDSVGLNGTSGIRSNATNDQEDNSGIFLSDADLETIIFGSAGMVVDVCQQVFSSFSQDCFLLSAISLWISTKTLKDQLKLWEDRISSGGDLNCELGSLRNIADNVVKDYKELSFLSKQINAITNSILPTMIMANIFLMAYFMHSLVTRQWYFALYLSFKLCKVWVAIYFAMKTSKVAETYYSWFISESVQEVLDLSSKQLHRIFRELKDSPVGNGSGVFYIDTRFLLSAEKYYSWFVSEEVQDVLDLSSKKLHRVFSEMKDSPVGIGSSVFYITLMSVSY